MATRGQVGGIARATEDIVRIMDASSMDYILVETVGAGQSDVDIKSLAQTIVIVTAPGLGDEIQALKAGIMEIGDIFVVNKADRVGADQSIQEIDSMVAMSEKTKGWRPRVLKTTALSGQGISTLVEAINQHNQHLRNSGAQKTDDLRIHIEIVDAAKRYFEDILLHELASTKEFTKLVAQVRKNKIDPYSAARKLIRHINERR
jgi:LAO/AO transport system kinase